MENSQERDAALPEDFTDCPKCGQKCRSIDDLDLNEFKGSSSRSRTRRRKLPSFANQHLPQVCQVCGFTEGLQTHHIDWNPNNNAQKNLQRLCQWCHIQANKLGKPEFDRLQEIVNADLGKRASLKQSSSRHYQSVKARRSK